MIGNENEATNQTNISAGQWCLVTVRQKRRDSFLICLDSDIQRQQLDEVILDVIAPEEAVYQDMVMIRASNFTEARSILQKIDHFQAIQRLSTKEVERMTS